MIAKVGENTFIEISIDQVWRRVRTRIANRIKLGVDSQGVRNYDEIAMTESERSDFNVLAERVSAQVYDAIQSLCVGVDNAYLYAEDSTNSTIRFICLMPAQWDPNTNSLLETQIMTVLELGITKEWFRMLGVQTPLIEIEPLFLDAMSDLKSTVYHRIDRGQRRYRIM